MHFISEHRDQRKWGRGDSNPHAFRHMILSHARLPIPTLPREAKSATDDTAKKVNQKVNQRRTRIFPKIKKKRHI